MDDPVVPYVHRSNGSLTNISSSQSGSSIAERCVFIMCNIYILVLPVYVVYHVALGLALHHRYHRNHLLLYIVLIVLVAFNKLIGGNSGMVFRLDVLEQPLRLGVTAEYHTLVQIMFQALAD